jgi:hypothetical protein
MIRYHPLLRYSPMSDTIPEPAGSIAHAQAAIDR